MKAKAAKDWKALLLRVRAHILAEPKRFGMARFVATGRPGARIDWGDGGGMRVVPACGTIACIGGWIVGLHDGRDRLRRTSVVGDRAKEILGLSWWDEPGLFLVHEWPGDLAADYNDATTNAARARIAAKRIDRYIKERVAEERVQALIS